MSLPAAAAEELTDRVVRLICKHPFPSRPLEPLLRRHLLTAELVDPVLRRLFLGHCDRLKCAEVFRFSLRHLRPSSRAFDTALQALARSGDLDEAWKLVEEVKDSDASLISRRSLAILLARYTKFKSFEETMAAFERMDKKIFEGLRFGVDEFNALLGAFCRRRDLLAARAVFRRLCDRFSPNSRTINTLLLGFKETRNIMAMELFYQDIVLRGFPVDVVTFNIRIDGYCKKGRIRDAIDILKEMKAKNISPTVETMTTLIHGACITKEPLLARQLFDEIPQRNLTPDAGAYNALMAAMVRSKDQRSAMELMEKMEAEGISPDNVTYHTALTGLMKSGGGAAATNKLFQCMLARQFVPAARTTISLMKFFCENERVDQGLELWKYLLQKGCCPHLHAMDLLVTALCCRGKVQEAHRCFMEMAEFGRTPSERSFRVLEGFLDGDMAEELRKTMGDLRN